MRIAIVNDMALAVEAIRRALQDQGQHEIVWVAKNGEEAVRFCQQNTPDLILMDLHMPVMNGVEATRQIMSRSPCAILVVAADVGSNSARVFEAMGAGALDVVSTPILAPGHRTAQGAAELFGKISLIGRLIGAERTGARPRPRETAPPRRADCLVAIGASAGGPMALARVLGGLPADFPAAIVVVQHVDEKFAAGMAQWLNDQVALNVRLARPGDVPQAGTVLMAGTDNHLTFTDEIHLDYTPTPTDLVYRPSVDVFFESMAAHWRGRGLGLLLTGMGRDGARGLKVLRDRSYHTIAQNQATCAVFGMPKAAIALQAAVEILPLEKIADALKEYSAQS